MADGPLLIEANQRPGSLVITWAFALFAAGFVGYPAYQAVFHSSGHQNAFWELCFISVFLLLAAWLVWRAVLATLDYGNHGRARLRLKRAALTSGTLSGTVEIEQAPPGLRAVNFRLVCVRRKIYKGDTEDDVTAPWTGSGTLRLQPAGTHSEAAVEVAIPAYLPASQALKLKGENHDLEFSWDLVVTDAAEAPSLVRTFTVNVGAGVDLSGADAAGTAPGPAYFEYLPFNRPGDEKKGATKTAVVFLVLVVVLALVLKEIQSRSLKKGRASDESQSTHARL